MADKIHPEIERGNTSGYRQREYEFGFRFDEVEAEATRRKVEELRKKHNEELAVYRTPIEEVDVSRAVLIQHDGDPLRWSQRALLNSLLRFQVICSDKNVFHCFAPQDCRTARVYQSFGSFSFYDVLKRVFSRDGDRDMELFKNTCLQHACAAVDLYNRASESKLRFEKLLAANQFFDYKKVVYVTFSAFHVESGKVDIFQAAVFKHNGEYYLGLLKMHGDDAVLARIYVTGVNDFYNAIKEDMYGLKM